MMRIVIAATPAALDRHRVVAAEVVRDLGGEVLTYGPELVSCFPESVDLLLLIVGRQLDPVAAPEHGGDGRRSYAQLATEKALRRALPLAVLRADDSWPERDAGEEGSRGEDTVPLGGVRGGDTVLHDFRAELARLAVPIPYESAQDALPAFRAVLEDELRRRTEDLRAGHASTASDRDPRPRTWPEPELPAEPYPLLLPVLHPALLGGRGRDLAELRHLLRQPQPILGLHAASGAGKSSLLLAGLVPELRAAGQPVALDRHPAEKGLAHRLIGDLLVLDEAFPDFDFDDVGTFVEYLLAAGRLSGQTPVLVLDQFEHLLSGGAAAARARIGRLLAATVQRQPGMPGAVCRWLLAYRREFHGEILSWLRDVLREARRDGSDPIEELPYALDRPERFHAWALPPLGRPRFLADRAAEAAAAFREAIAVPLVAVGGYRFEDGGLDRLARVFGEARVARPEAPLVPQLQVVLAHLLARAGTPTGREPLLVPVPEDPESRIEEALEHHLRQVFATVFVPSGGSGGGNPAAGVRRRRSAALLALRELVTEDGRRAPARPADLLAHALGAEGEEILERLAGPRARLITLEEHPEGWRAAVAHDQLARVIVRFVDDEQAGLDFDRELLALRRFVRLKTELFTSGELRQATRLARRRRQYIAAHTDALLQDETSRTWWTACRARQRRRRRGLTLAAFLWVLLAVTGAQLVERRARRAALHETIATGEPEHALGAVRELLGPAPPDELRQALERRRHPLDMLENTLGGVPTDDRGDVILDVARLALPFLAGRIARLDSGEPCPVELQKKSTEIVRPLATLLRALEDMSGSAGETIRVQALESLRNLCPPPDFSATQWVDIPAGELPADVSESVDGCLDAPPPHPVVDSPFRMLRRKVTLAEFRLLFPAHELKRDGETRPEDPVEEATWYEAWVYAAWLGGRLPTEAEWEHAARRPPPALEEMVSRVGEWTADFSSSGGKRIYRGGSSDPSNITCRREMEPWEPSPWIGFRIVLPPEPISGAQARR